jgi:carbonic anhydrase
VSVFDELLAANDKFASTFEPGMLPAPPRRRLAVVTCMDARILPLSVFGLEPGDAHVIRNAGGRVSDDVIRSLLVSTHVLGVQAVAVVHHTECGMTQRTDEQFRALVAERSGEDVTDVEFLAIEDADAALAEDVETIRSSPLLPAGTAVNGFQYDVASGRLERRVE